MATTKRPTAVGQPQNSKLAIALDPLDVNGRLYRQIARLLDQLEAEDVEGGITIPQRINALIAVGRIQVIFANLRKAAANDGHDPGSEVRKYSQAFAAKTHGNGFGAKHSGAGGFIPVDSDGDDDGGHAA